MKSSKLLNYEEVSDYVDYPRIFFCNNLNGDEPYLMVCPTRLDYELFDDAVAEDYYYNNENIKKVYIDPGNKIIVRYFTRQGLAYTSGVIDDIDSEDHLIYMKDGTEIDADSIESIGLV